MKYFMCWFTFVICLFSNNFYTYTHNFLWFLCVILDIKKTAMAIAIAIASETVTAIAV